MATNTTNYGWTKPDYEDDADIAVLNETFDAIDEQVKTVETALNNKQSALSTSQLAAVNSGIDSEKVAQIETNKNNIFWNQQKLIEIVDSGNKNLIPCDIPAGSFVSNTLTITNNQQIENGFGTSTKHTMKDADGNVFIWFTAAKNWPVGDIKHIRGTVKQHSTSRNTKETILTRCAEL
jgi:hypothetical protein